jgi:hypothetical protein
MSKKEDKPMGVVAAVEDVGFIDMREQLAPKQVKAYVERRMAIDGVEYNHGSILVRSKHPMDECLRRGIIEEEHHESAKRIRNYRDCAVSKLSGRMYNAAGEGDPEMDAGTVYAQVMRAMRKTSGGQNQWRLISIVCFAEPDIDGKYLSEGEYACLYQLAPNIQHAFEAADLVFSEVRKELQRKIEEEKKKREQQTLKTR